MRISTALVTGGAGFIGSSLVRHLKDQGVSVVAVDNLVNGKRENIDPLLGNQVSLEVMDIRDEAGMAALMNGVDTVFHLACLGVRHSIHSPIENNEVNATATLSLLESARKHGVGRFVYVSSSEVYGTAKSCPMPEEHPAFPHTVYGASKLAGECHTRAYHDAYGMDTVVVRPFNAFGPRCHHEGDSGEVIPKFMLRCMAGKPLIVFGDGTQTRDFTYVDDTARGIYLAGICDEAVGQTINLGSNAEVQVKNLARLVAETVGRPEAVVEHDAPRPGDVLRLFSDSSKARDLLGFSPEVPLREGLSRLFRWYVDQGKDANELLADETVHNWEPKD